jgi:ABC-2 type transport system permease protein
MRNEIVSEFRKLTTTRSPYWLLVALVGVAGIVAAGGLLSEDFAEDLTKPLQHQPFLLLPLSTAILFTMILGIRSFTDEFRNGSIVPTLLVTPDRRRLLTAKVIAVGAASTIYMVAAFGTALAVGVPGLMAKGLGVTWSAGDLAAVLGRAIAAGALWSVIGVGLGLAVRNQVVALVGVAVWSMGVETAIGAAFKGTEKYLPDAAGTAIIGFDAGDLLSPAAAIAVLLGCTLVVVMAGERLMERRDVT